MDFGACNGSRPSTVHGVRQRPICYEAFDLKRDASVCASRFGLVEIHNSVANQNIDRDI
jgi:hypothetical protein